MTKSARALTAVLASIVLLGAAAIIVTVLVGGGYKVRYEVETTSGTALMISWSTAGGGMDKAGMESPTSTVNTPWATEVTFEDTSALVSVAVTSPQAAATCRIFVDGTKHAEFSTANGTVCEVLLSDVAG